MTCDSAYYYQVSIYGNGQCNFIGWINFIGNDPGFIRFNYYIGIILYLAIWIAKLMLMGV